MKNRVIKKTAKQKELEKMLLVKNVRVGKTWRKKYVGKNNKWERAETNI